MYSHVTFVHLDQALVLRGIKMRVSHLQIPHVVRGPLGPLN